MNTKNQVMLPHEQLSKANIKPFKTSSAQQQKYIPPANWRLVNSSSDLIRIKSKLSEMHAPRSVPIFHQCNFDRAHTCDPMVKFLIDRAFTTIITRRDQQFVLNELLMKPNLIHEIDITLTKIPELIEKNPLIAYEILFKLIDNQNDKVFYQILLKIPLTQRSFEVMNRLCTTAELPKEVLKHYIRNATDWCERMRGQQIQAQFVCLICVFLQTLIRNKIKVLQDLFFELKAFCINFYEIKEATNLYSMIKHLETAGYGSSEHNELKWCAIQSGSNKKDGLIIGNEIKPIKPQKEFKVKKLEKPTKIEIA